MRARIFAEENRRWWTLGALSFALFMIMLDNTIVNVALPAIKNDLHIGVSELEWVVTAYALTFAVLLLTGGKLGGLLARRLIFTIGLVVFRASSLACGLSSSATELIGARAVQGVGSALMMPATLSIISATFAARERGMAIGIWAGVSAMALAIGPLAGGIITEHLAWNWILYINVPIGVLGLITTVFVVPESRDTSHEQRLDVPGLVTSGIGLFALVYALIEGHSFGWTSGRILGLFAVAAVSLSAFSLLELHQRLPMLDLSLLRNGTFAGANLVAILVTLAMFGIFVFFPIYMQSFRGWSPIQAGAALLPWTLMVVVFAPIAGKLSDRVGSRWLMTAGMTVVALCCLELSTVTLTSSSWPRRHERRAPSDGRPRAAAVRARGRHAGVRALELPRSDDRGDRAPVRDQRAGPVPALLLQARPLRRVPRGGLVAREEPLAGGARERARPGLQARRDGAGLRRAAALTDHALRPLGAGAQRGGGRPEDPPLPPRPGA